LFLLHEPAVTIRILIVEDEPDIRDLLDMSLRHAGYQVLQACDVDSARRHMDAALPDLILLDWMLPDRSGIDLARELRSDARTRELPIIMLTARTSESDKLSGFDAGADDYVTKPFSPRELIARVRAMLRRRTPQTGDETLEAGGLRLDPATFRVSADGQPVRLGPTEFRLLQFFMRHPDRVL
jgi:two-component system phosphate regulon response regulator PhoB